MATAGIGAPKMGTHYVDKIILAFAVLVVASFSFFLQEELVEEIHPRFSEVEKNRESITEKKDRLDGESQTGGLRSQLTALEQNIASLEAQIPLKTNRLVGDLERFISGFGVAELPEVPNLDFRFADFSQINWDDASRVPEIEGLLLHLERLKDSGWYGTTSDSILDGYCNISSDPESLGYDCNRNLEDVFLGLEGFRSEVNSRLISAINGLSQNAYDFSLTAEELSGSVNGLLQTQSNLQQAQLDRIGLQRSISSTELEIELLETINDDILADTKNMYLAIRGFCLGAIGAFAAALAAFLKARSAHETDRRSVIAKFNAGPALASMLLGGLVALVVLGLFSTRQISIFDVEFDPTGLAPDYWRMVLLCMGAGAFADRLFAMAGDRVDQISGRDGDGVSPSYGDANPPDANNGANVVTDGNGSRGTRP